jgi:hypothetical protein
MNDPAPLTAEQIDELLSAELDGEFDAAAHDLGYAPADARSQLQAVEGVDERRRALAEARDVLAAHPPFDELLESRLQAKALNAWAEQREEHETLRRGSRRRRMYAMTGALAAAITAVVIVAAVARDPANETDTAASRVESPAPTAEASAPASTLNVDFGEVDDVPALVALARDIDAAGRAATEGSLSEDAVEGLPRKTNGGEFVPVPAASDNALKNVDACADAARQASQLTKPFLRGLATVDGETVQVFVYRTDTRELVIVLDADCNLVTQQTGPPRTG